MVIQNPQPPPPAAATDEPVVPMPRTLFPLAVFYLSALITLFIVYVSWSAFRSNAPSSFGQIPVGVVWFGAIGAEVISLYGIFVHNHEWKASYNYWHYIRPLFGAVTGSIGALLYLVALQLGSKGKVTVDPLTFYAVAFIFGFADKSFLQMVKNVTDVIVKPGKQT
jgi:hypothetical protein